jgi:hypothetical protein
MIIRRNLLQGLAAGAATMSLSSHFALATGDAVIQSDDEFNEYLEACIIACEESEIPDENINTVDYWTLNVGHLYETRLPEGCRKIVILDNDISPSRVVQGITKLYQSIPKHFDFDPLDHPNHCVLHIEGITDITERIRSVLATKSARNPKTTAAIVNLDSVAFYLSSDWDEILPTLRTHYDRIISFSIVDENQDPDFYPPEFTTYLKERQTELAKHCDASVEIPLPHYFRAKEPHYEQTTNLVGEIADVFLRKTPAEVSALPTCGVISFRDWMALVA